MPKAGGDGENVFFRYVYSFKPQKYRNIQRHFNADIYCKEWTVVMSRIKLLIALILIFIILFTALIWDQHTLFLSPQKFIITCSMVFNR